jgi:hypothetical protein
MNKRRRRRKVELKIPKMKNHEVFRVNPSKEMRHTLFKDENITYRNIFLLINFTTPLPLSFILNIRIMYLLDNAKVIIYFHTNINLLNETRKDRSMEAEGEDSETMDKVSRFSYLIYFCI